MKLITVILLLLNFSSVKAIEPDRRASCTVDNGWSVQADYYWDGHPQGPGGWSGVVQINDWGKFIVKVDDHPTWIVIGNTNGPARLDDYKIEFSLIEKANKKFSGPFKISVTDVMNNTHVYNHTIECRQL